MKKILQFNSGYFIGAIVLLAVEIVIALFVHDAIIRPYIGDLLVVILIYCMVRSFFNTPVFATAIGVLLFAFTLEILQYFKLVELLGLQNYKAARIIIGSAFEWIDLLAYTAGIMVVLFIEKRLLKHT